MSEPEHLPSEVADLLLAGDLLDVLAAAMTEALVAVAFLLDVDEDLAEDQREDWRVRDAIEGRR